MFSHLKEPPPKPMMRWTCRPYALGCGGGSVVSGECSNAVRRVLMCDVHAELTAECHVLGNASQCGGVFVFFFAVAWERNSVPAVAGA
ncbi:hypothetical protein ACFVT2_42450 [Streptomyces sp. NPDC058000]|uniref:hypothetical protein n=1 Tax=Streptomyces sp. NPDC058000 TaxID=3346299 RepID=UPI0036EBF528